MLNENVAFLVKLFRHQGLVDKAVSQIAKAEQNHRGKNADDDGRKNSALQLIGEGSLVSLVFFGASALVVAGNGQADVEHFFQMPRKLPGRNLLQYFFDYFKNNFVGKLVFSDHVLNGDAHVKRIVAEVLFEFLVFVFSQGSSLLSVAGDGAGKVNLVQAALLSVVGVRIGALFRKARNAKVVAASFQREVVAGL